MEGKHREIQGWAHRSAARPLFARVLHYDGNCRMRPAKHLPLFGIWCFCAVRLFWALVMEQKPRVVVGMSGGVDSSAAAALLLEQGYDVIGITLKLWPQDCVNRAEDKCCGPQAVTDARAVCDKLGVPYYLIDEAAEFQKHVIQYFAD